MVDTTYDAATDRWLCPDDRQLALRGRLETGWSTIPDTGYRKTHTTNFTDEEKLVIEEVMRRATELEMSEQLRIGALVENVEQTRRSLHGNGQSNCLVCGYKSGFLKEILRKCLNCGRVVCNKCSVETSERTVLGDVGKCYYCVVCFEERELWKRSGAWFFKMLPKYITPGNHSILSGRSKKPHSSVGSAESGTLYDTEIQNDYVDGRHYSVESDDSDAEMQDYRRSGTSAFHQYGASSDDEDTISGKTSTPKSFGFGVPERLNNRRAGMVMDIPVSEDEDDRKSENISFRKESLRSLDSMISSSSQSADEVKRRVGHTNIAEEAMTNGSPVTSKGRPSIDQGGLVRQSEERKSTTERKEYHGSLGMIEFKMQYNESEQTLQVLIKFARGLKAMDFGKTSDPYVKVYITPGHLKSTKHKTKVHYKTLDPDFNEEFTYYGITERDLKQKMIRSAFDNADQSAGLKYHRMANNADLSVCCFGVPRMMCLGRLVVMDENKLSSNAFIGETYVALNNLVNRPTQNLKRLLDPYTGHDAGGKEEDYRGKIQISLQYVTKKNKLVVGIERCVDLKPMDPNGYSDPYVKLYLVPDKKKATKKKTRVIKKDLNPQFHEEFAYEMPISILAGKTLLVSVWDRDVGSSNDFIGAVALGNSSREDALKHWFETLKFTDQKKTYWHTLSPELQVDVD